MKLDDILNTPELTADTAEPFFSLHNKLFEEVEWYMHSQATRERVMDNLREWVKFMQRIFTVNVRGMTKADKIRMLKTHNALLPGVKEISYSCASCRNRMINRLKKELL